MNIHDRYHNLDADEIERMIREGFSEDLYIEFKTVNNAHLTNKEDKQNFAKSLSGFANSSGGLIIWGVVASKNEENIDCASGKSEITPLSLFVSRLNSLTGEMVVPQVEGVEHRKIETGRDRGFAVTLVPESDAGPHMAKAGLNRYYKRSGDSFYVMEHYDIEDMFGRRKKPKLKLSTQIERGPVLIGRGVCTLKVIIGIRNEGRGSAKAPFLALRIHPPYAISAYELDGNGKSGLERLKTSPRSGWAKYGGCLYDVIQPGTVREVTLVDVPVDLENPNISDLRIEYELAAEDVKLQKGCATVSGGELLERAQKFLSQT